MKQSMNYEANQTNLATMWLVESERLNHLRRLNTIYQDKTHPRKSHEEHELQKQHYMLLHLNNKEKDARRKLKSEQNRINHQNEILRHKLIDLSLNSTLKPRPLHTTTNLQHSDTPLDHSLSQIRPTHPDKRSPSHSLNYMRKQQKLKIQEQNNRFYMKLANMKSDVMHRLAIGDHMKKTEQLKDKLEKKSPRRVRLIRSFFKRRHHGHAETPTHVQSNIENQEELQD